MLTESERQALIERAATTPSVHSSPTFVYHYSEDGGISRFAPHVPPTNPSHPPAVWAMDEEHSPLYWFPRDCPRISVWANDEEQRTRLRELFHTDATRICAAESGWLTRVRDATVYRYSFDAAQFSPWADADGQYVAGETVHPVAVDALDDLLGLHAESEIDLRFIPWLGTLMDHMLASGLPFGFVRIRDARR